MKGFIPDIVLEVFVGVMDLFLTSIAVMIGVKIALM